MAETWGVDEIRIDASTAAAVIIRASLFMSLTGFWVCLGIAGVSAEIAAIPMTSTLAPQATSGCPTGYKVQYLFPGVEPGDFSFGLAGDGNGQSTRHKRRLSHRSVYITVRARPLYSAAA